MKHWEKDHFQTFQDQVAPTGCGFACKKCFEKFPPLSFLKVVENEIERPEQNAYWRWWRECQANGVDNQGGDDNRGGDDAAPGGGMISAAGACGAYS